MASLGASFRLLYDHLGLGLTASVLFAAGLATSLAIVRRDVRWMMAFPLWVVRRVLLFIGPGFPPVRVFLTIFCFNSVAIFLYMVSGVLIVVPAAIAFLTGVNIGVIVLKAGEVEVAQGERPLAVAMNPPEDYVTAPWVSLCSLAVLVLELPSFWIAVGLGIRMGRELSRVGHYTLQNMLSLLGPRVTAYWTIVIPALFLSALAETAAIRGHVSGRQAPEASDEARPAPPSDGESAPGSDEDSEDSGDGPSAA